MLTTILAVQAELQSRIDYIRNSDIYIAPSVYSINTGVKFPCIGIKDGKPVPGELAGGAVEWTLPVHLSIFVKLSKDAERAITGDDATSRPGVLAITADIRVILGNNLLGLTGHGMQSAIISEESASEMFIDPKSNGIQRKQLTVTYTREQEGYCGG